MLSLLGPGRGLPSIHYQEQFPVLFFQSACLFHGEKIGFHLWAVKYD